MARSPRQWMVPHAREAARWGQAGFSQEDAWMHSNNAKRVAETELLRDPEWLERSDRSIARQCGVSARGVGSHRAGPRCCSACGAGRRRIRVAGIGRKSRADCQLLTVAASSEGDDADPEEKLCGLWRRAVEAGKRSVP